MPFNSKYIELFKKPVIQGLIFDCDGLLVDSEPLSCRALNVLFEKNFNIDIGTDYTDVLGKTVKDGILIYFKKFNLTYSNIEELLVEKDEIYKDLAAQKLKSFSGVEKFIKYVLEQNYDLAVASSGSLDKINFSLSVTSLLKNFSVITSSSEVLNGKPAPDIFLKTAKKLNLHPHRCIVFEDSIFGIEAAKKAEMTAIGITNSFTQDELIRAGADIAIESFMDLLNYESLPIN